MASPRTSGRVPWPLLATGLLLAACRASSPATQDGDKPVPPEPLASVRASRASDIPRCQEDLLRLCADPLAALPEEESGSLYGTYLKEAGKELPQDFKAPTCEPGKAAECHAAAQEVQRRTDLRTAFPAYKEACAMGFAPSCELLIRAFKKDRESPAAEACALAFASKACQAGAAEACTLRADAQDLPDGLAFDPTCATAAREKACELGQGGDCVDLRLALTWPGRRALEAGAPRLAEQACALGMTGSCSVAARHHEHGHGVPADHSKALRFHEDACDLGSATACIEGGLLRSEQAKRPAEQRYAELQLAHGLQRTESSRGDMLASLKLAIGYEEGAEGVAAAPARARLLLERLSALCRPVSKAERDAADALPVDTLKALRKRELQRASSACLELGLAREAGIGGSVDVKAARELFARACEGKPTGCILHWSALLQEGTPEEQAQARKELTSWQDNLPSQSDDLLRVSTRLAPSAVRISQAACLGGNEEVCAGRIRVRAFIAGQAEGALAELEELCGAGRPDACEFAVRVLASAPPGVTRPDVRLAELNHAACAGGIGMACVRLAGLQDDGRVSGTPGVPTETVYRQHCREGMRGCWRPALKWLEAPAERGKALKWLKTQCDMDEPRACAALGTAFLEGRHVVQDGYAAANFLSRACSQEDGASCARLATLLEQHGGEAHAEDAARARSQACRLKALPCDEKGGAR
jgi:TPR repeat protein